MKIQKCLAVFWVVVYVSFGGYDVKNSNSLISKITFRDIGIGFQMVNRTSTDLAKSTDFDH